MPTHSDEASLVSRALLKWPNVPANYGWLRLDGRGRWRIQDEIIQHRGIVSFLARQYSSDASGRWYVQNGPQRAYVQLDLAPWILSLASETRLEFHTGQPVLTIESLMVTEDGQLFLATERGLGALSDRDLDSFLSNLRRVEYTSPDPTLPEYLLMLCDKPETKNELIWCGFQFSCRYLRSDSLESAYGFIRHPIATTETRME